MLETRQQIEIDEQTVQKGYRQARSVVKKYLKPYHWLISNVAGENRQGLDAILAHLLTTTELLDLESTNGLSLPVWQEVRDNLSDAFSDKFARVELAALVDTCRRFQIPREFLFDPLRGADLWIRARRFQNYAELETFASYIGGSIMLAMVPVLGHVQDDYEAPAIACGKAVMLTQVLANCVDDFKHNRFFLAQDDLKEYEVDVSRCKLRQGHPALRHFVRLYVTRLTELYHQAGPLIACLDFDGKRSVRSLLALHWKILTRLQQDPESVLREDGVLSKREMLAIRSRHMLGIEPKLPFAAADDHGHH